MLLFILLSFTAMSSRLEQKEGKMFKSNVKSLMEKKKKTFQEIVDNSGISRQTIHKARQDSGISECRLSTLGRIAKALEVGTKELYEEEAVKEQKE